MDFSYKLASFIIIEWSSLSLVILFTLESALSGIAVASPTFFLLLVAQYIFSHPFILNYFVLFYIESMFLVSCIYLDLATPRHSWQSLPFLGVLRPFMFIVMTDMVMFRSVILGLIFYLFHMLFFPFSSFSSFALIIFYDSILTPSLLFGYNFLFCWFRVCFVVLGFTVCILNLSQSAFNW